MTHANSNHAAASIFPGDSDMHNHSGLTGVIHPSFLDVVQEKDDQAGKVTLYWPFVSCFDEMAKTMERLRALLESWGLTPSKHSLARSVKIGKLAPTTLHDLLFTSGEVGYTLNDLQLDVIQRELNIGCRYPGFVTATPVQLENGRKTHRLTMERIADPNSTDFVKVIGSAASPYADVRKNLRWTLTPGIGKTWPLVTEEDVWRFGYAALTQMNAHLMDVTFD